MIIETWSLINPIVKSLSYLLLIVTIGNILFLIHFMKNLTIQQIQFSYNNIKIFSLIGMLVSMLTFITLLGNMSGDFKGIFEIYIISASFQTLAFKSFLLSLVGYFIIFLCQILQINSIALKLMGSIFLLSSFIILGHSTKNGIISQSLLIVHLVGISYWIGSLLPILKLCNDLNFNELIIVSKKFGNYAIGYILLILFSGLTFSYLLLGSFEKLFFSNYGNVLLLKLFFVSFLLFMGTLNKFYFVPKLISKKTIFLNQFKKSILIEMLIVFVIFFITGILTTSLDLPSLE